MTCQSTELGNSPVWWKAQFPSIKRVQIVRIFKSDEMPSIAAGLTMTLDSNKCDLVSELNSHADYDC